MTYMVAQVINKVEFIKNIVAVLVVAGVGVSGVDVVAIVFVDFVVLVVVVVVVDDVVGRVDVRSTFLIERFFLAVTYRGILSSNLFCSNIRCKVGRSKLQHNINPGQ